MQARPIQQGWVSQGELSVCTEVRVRARVWDTGQQVERDGPQGEEEGRIAAAQVAAMVRVDLEGRPVGRRNARLEMNRDNQPATGAKSDTHTAEHLTPWP